MKDIKKILIVGGGTSGYLTAYYLLKNFSNINIEWVFPEENNSIGVGEATIPLVQSFLSDLGIDLETIITKCNGSIKLGLEFEGFYEKGHSYFHPFFSEFKNSIKNTFLMKNNLIDLKLHSNKENYAIHFDVSELTKYLDIEINKFKNINIFREYAGIILKDENNNILSIGNKTADLYIDCTGFSRKVINTVSAEDNFIDITNIIPNNATLVYRNKYTDKENQLKNFTKCIAMEYGWCWNIPLGDKLSVGYVYDDKYDVYDEFIKYLVGLFGEIDESKIVSLKIKTGRNKKHIINNVIAIGLSSCFIEPLESTGLYFVVKNIDSLGKYLQGDINEDKFNEIINNEFDDVINFILAHYKYTKNTNQYWSYYKNIPISIYEDPHLFNKNSWYMILKGMGRKDLIKSSLGENVYKSYTVIESIFDYSKYSNDKISYIDWLNSIDYSNWKNDKMLNK